MSETHYPVLDLTTDELLTTTRTVRKRLDLTKPVPLELVEECLTIALQAPSGSNKQGWQWIVVTDPDVRSRIGAIYGEEVRKYLGAKGSAASLFPDDPERASTQQRVGDSAAWLGERMGDVPVLVIPCIEAESPLPAANQAGLWGSLLPAAWSYALAARSRGLGTAWTTLHLNREAEVAEILGIPDNFRQGALIPTAYFTGETFKVAPRAPLESVLHRDRW